MQTVQFSSLPRVNHSASETQSICRLYPGKEDAVSCRNRVIEVVRMRSESEVRHRSLNGTYGEDTRRVDIDEQPQMILELAKHVEGTAGDALQEDRCPRLYQRAPRLP